MENLPRNFCLAKSLLQTFAIGLHAACRHSGLVNLRGKPIPGKGIGKWGEVGVRKKKLGLHNPKFGAKSDCNIVSVFKLL